MYYKEILAETVGICGGMGIKSRIYVLKVFNSSGESTTGIILKALKFCLKRKVKIVVLPFGTIIRGVKRIDRILKRLIEKERIIITAIGNEGTNFGTISYPGKSLFSISVGSYNFEKKSICSFTSRGPDPELLKKGIGITKPNLLLDGSHIYVRKSNEKDCIKKSGTSFVAVILAGLLLRIKKSVNESLNHGSVLIHLAKSTERLVNNSWFEQGFGVLDPKLFLMPLIKEDVYIFPEEVDLRNNSASFQPFSLQPFFQSEEYRFLNFTISSSVPSYLKVLKIEFVTHPYLEHLEASFKHSNRFFHVGFFSVKFRVNKSSVRLNQKMNISVTLETAKNSRIYSSTVSVLFNIIERPSPKRMVLIDNRHNLVHPFDAKVWRLF